MCEYTIAAELGELFIVADEVSRVRAIGERVMLSLGQRGVALLGHWLMLNRSAVRAASRIA